MKQFLITLALMTALWDSAISATLIWQSPTRACLSSSRAFIGCYDAGRVTVRLGGAQTDGAFRPVPGERYFLTDGAGRVLQSARLVGRPVYLPIIR